MNRSLKPLFITLAMYASAPAWADNWPTEPTSAAELETEQRAPSTTVRRIVLAHSNIDLTMSPPKDGKAELNTIVNHPGERDKSRPAPGVSLKIAGQNIARTGESISVGNGMWSHHQFFTLDSKRQWPPSIVVTYNNESATVDFKTQDSAQNKTTKSAVNTLAHTRQTSFGNAMANQANKMATVENPYKKGSSASVIAERRGDLAAKNRQVSDHP